MPTNKFENFWIFFFIIFCFNFKRGNETILHNNNGNLLIYKSKIFFDAHCMLLRFSELNIFKNHYYMVGYPKRVHFLTRFIKQKQTQTYANIYKQSNDFFFILNLLKLEM